MKIVDRSGGFWLDVFQKRKDPEVAFRQNYLPDKVATKMLAGEIISGMKGSVKHKIMVRHINGRLVISRVPNGSYSTGIMKRKSPDGTDYEPLSPVTLAIRKMDGITRGAAFILRATSEHIFNGLKIKSLEFTKKGSKVAIGWTGENEVIAVQQDQGFEVKAARKTESGGLSQYTIKTPARHHIGISEETINVLTSFWKKIAK